jgi:maltose alpha-D-glucosyltransferase/alpha-amylase
MVLETIPVPYNASVAHVALLRVEYTEGEPETFVLPLAFAAGADAERVRTALPQAVIARLAVKARQTREASGTVRGVLYDPLGDCPILRSRLLCQLEVSDARRACPP